MANKHEKQTLDLGGNFSFFRIKSVVCFALQYHQLIGTILFLKVLKCMYSTYELFLGCPVLNHDKDISVVYKIVWM